jgi:hypothetical protein
VPLERPDGLFVDRLQTVTFELDPDAEVRNGLEMESRNLVVISGAEEPPIVLTEQLLKSLRPDGR